MLKERILIEYLVQCNSLALEKLFLEGRDILQHESLFTLIFAEPTNLCVVEL